MDGKGFSKLTTLGRRRRALGLAGKRGAAALGVNLGRRLLAVTVGPLLGQRAAGMAAQRWRPLGQLFGLCGVWARVDG